MLYKPLLLICGLAIAGAAGKGGRGGGSRGGTSSSHSDLDTDSDSESSLDSSSGSSTSDSDSGVSWVGGGSSTSTSTSSSNSNPRPNRPSDALLDRLSDADEAAVAGHTPASCTALLASGTACPFRGPVDLPGTPGGLVDPAQERECVGRTLAACQVRPPLLLQAAQGYLAARAEDESESESESSAQQARTAYQRQLLPLLLLVKAARSGPLAARGARDELAAVKQLFASAPALDQFRALALTPRGKPLLDGVFAGAAEEEAKAKTKTGTKKGKRGKGGGGAVVAAREEKEEEGKSPVVTLYKRPSNLDTMQRLVLAVLGAITLPLLNLYIKMIWLECSLIGKKITKHRHPDHVFDKKHCP